MKNLSWSSCNTIQHACIQYDTHMHIYIDLFIKKQIVSLSNVERLISYCHC